MLANRLTEIPEEDGLLFEPKWDGFRTLVFRDGDELILQSRDKKPMARYFPELLEPLKKHLPARCVVDGEVIIERGGALDFEALQTRLHPAASRVAMLSKELPASIVLWDLLAEGDESLLQVPFGTRRERLVRALATREPPVFLTPATTDRALASKWFHEFEGAGLDGIMAKPLTGTYQPNKRVMYKVKHLRTCDAVVAGFRWHKDGPGTLVGSLMLGLYDDAGLLHSIGVTASFTAAKRKELVQVLAPFREGAAEAHPWLKGRADAARRPEKSRWSAGKTLEWEPLRIALVAEVAYDHMQGRRFRHTAQFRHFRQDRTPESCNYSQLEVTPPEELAKILARR
jgi:ATP-dependent DNA ligase